MEKYDVVVVGACTAGTYFANLIAKAGHKVLVIDKDKIENLSKRLDIFHFIYSCFKEYDIPEPKEGDEEFVRTFDTFYSRSALNNYEKHTHDKVAVMHLPLFIKKLRNIAEGNGAKFQFETKFIDLIKDESGKIKGIKVEYEGQPMEIEAKMVVDASGIPSVVRRKIEDPYMETFEIGPKDKFYVLLKYVELLNPEDKILFSTSWPYFKSWIAPQHSGNGAIIGTGDSLSYAYVRKCMNKFLSKIPLPEWKLSYEEMGCTPYRRPPFSFVSDNFLVLGDSAALTKPWSGEGVTACWTIAREAGKVVNECLDKDDLSVKALWPINVFYQRGEGAVYARDRAYLIGAIDMSEKENDFLFKNSIIFASDDDDQSDNAKKMIKGVLKGEFSLRSFNKLLSSVSKGNNLEKHYKTYPENYLDYFKWVKKAEHLWKKAGRIADTIKDE